MLNKSIRKFFRMLVITKFERLDCNKKNKKDKRKKDVTLQRNKQFQ